MKKLVVGLAVTSAICLLAGCSSLSSTTPAAAPQFANEQDWIVSSIGKDISQIVLFAARKTKPSLDPSQVSLSVKDGGAYSYAFSMNCADFPAQSANIKLTNFIWDPNNYVVWASQLAKAAALQPAGGADDTSSKVVDTLSDFTPSSLVETDKSISAALSANPLDPNANEQAALLCALYGLREDATPYSELRPWLNRIVTHLAIAQSARDGKPMSSAGQLAQIAVLTQARRTAEALTAINEMRKVKQDDACASWLRALEIRCTGDFRVADRDHGRLVERLEYGKALANGQGPDALTEYLKKSKTDNLPIDWIRAGSRGRQTVDSGNFYVEKSIAAEQTDAAQDLKLFKGVVTKDRNELIVQLSNPPGLCLVKDPDWRLEAISWDDLSDFHNRHLLSAIYTTFSYVRVASGSKEYALQFADKFISNFGKLPLFPLCVLNMRAVKHENIGDDPSPAIAKLCSDSPQRVSAEEWILAKHVADPEAIPDYTAWFSLPSPFGTAFDCEQRQFGSQSKLETATQLRTYDPYNAWLDKNWAQLKYGKDLTGDELAEAYGKQVDYAVTPMWNVSELYKDKDESKYVAYLQRMSDFDPDMAYSLGDFYKKRDPAKAVAAFERAIKFGRDNVRKSMFCGWLVDYYFDHGKRDEALDLAKQAAQTETVNGIATLARVYEKSGKLNDAENCYKAIEERFGNTEGLVSFYERHMKDFPQGAEAIDRAIQKVYPNGVQKYDFAKLSGPPIDGLIVNRVGSPSSDAGLKVGDIMIGINGFQVVNGNQFIFAKDAIPDDIMEVVVWDGKAYKKITFNAPLHKVAIGVNAYHKEK